MHLARAAKFAKSLENLAGSFLHAAIRIEAETDLSMPDIADRHGDPEFTSSGLGSCSIKHPRSQNAKLEFADAALHAQEQAIIRATRVVHAIEVDDAGIDETAQLEQMMPVPAVTCEAGGIEAKYRTDLAGAESGDELVEAWARHGAAGRPAQVVVDNLDIPKSPAARFIDEVILAALALEIDHHLGLSGLAHIHDRLAAQHRRWQGISVRHHRSPRDLLRRPPTEGGQNAERWCGDRHSSYPSTSADPATSRIDGVAGCKQSGASAIA